MKQQEKEILEDVPRYRTRDIVVGDSQTAHGQEEIVPERELAERTGILDLIVPIAEGWRFVLKVTLIASVLAICIALLLPKRYTAEARILPPQQPTSSLGSLLSSQLGQLGALSGIAGKDLGL